MTDRIVGVLMMALPAFTLIVAIFVDMGMKKFLQLCLIWLVIVALYISFVIGAALACGDITLKGILMWSLKRKIK